MLAKAAPNLEASPHLGNSVCATTLANYNHPIAMVIVQGIGRPPQKEEKTLQHYIEVKEHLKTVIQKK